MARPATVPPPPGTQLSELELVARVFRALGEARRLSILERLLEVGEMSQVELFRELEIPQSRISQHVQCLAWCGFLEIERRGRRVIYRVDPRARDFVRMARQFLAANRAAIGSCGELES